MICYSEIFIEHYDVDVFRVVVNYDFPTGVEDYVHRIGRTGRAGATGIAYTFFGDQDAKHASDLVKVLEGANQKVPPEIRDMASRGGGMMSKLRRWGPGGRDSGYGGGGRAGSGYGGGGGRSDSGYGGGGGSGRYGGSGNGGSGGSGWGYTPTATNWSEKVAAGGRGPGNDFQDRDRGGYDRGYDSRKTRSRSRSRSPGRFNRV